MNWSSARSGAPASTNAETAAAASSARARDCMEVPPVGLIGVTGPAVLRGTPRLRRAAGAAKKPSASACSSTRPPLRNTTSCASRRAWPTSWVTSTILVPAACARSIRRSIAWVEAGSRCAVGSSRNSTSGPRLSARARARRCCSPPDSTARRAARERQQAGEFQHLLAAARPLGRRQAPARQRMADVGERRAAQQHRALEDHRLALAHGMVGWAPAPQHGAGGRRAAGRAEGAASGSCRRRSGP